MESAIDSRITLQSIKIDRRSLNTLNLADLMEVYILINPHNLVTSAVALFLLQSFWYYMPPQNTILRISICVISF